MFPRKLARTGDFIKDCSPLKRSLGLVFQVDPEIGQMYVRFPKLGEFKWVLWDNNGQYIVIDDSAISPTKESV
jgi:hypothetical protein